MPVEKHYSGLDGVACSAQKGGDMYTALVKDPKEKRITGLQIDEVGINPYSRFMACCSN